MALTGEAKKEYQKQYMADLRQKQALEQESDAPEQSTSDANVLDLSNVPPENDTKLDPKDVRPINYGTDDCTCLHCQQLKTNGVKGKLNHGVPMFAAQLRDAGYIANRVSLPGDIDYKGVAMGGLKIVDK
jgi:hypothetical protein